MPSSRSIRRDFLWLSLAVEGGLAVAALLLGWLVFESPLTRLGDLPSGAVWGAAATAPLLAGFFALRAIPWDSLRRIQRFLHEHLGPSLAQCSWLELAFVAALAGVGEELMFRGVLQPWCGVWVASALFGLAHAVTPTYALLATAIGLYLGWLFDASGGLIAPIVTHALYDFVAFQVVARDERSHTSQ